MFKIEKAFSRHFVIRKGGEQALLNLKKTTPLLLLIKKGERRVAFKKLKAHYF